MPAGPPVQAPSDCWPKERGDQGDRAPCPDPGLGCQDKADMAGDACLHDGHAVTSLSFCSALSPLLSSGPQSRLFLIPLSPHSSLSSSSASPRPPSPPPPLSASSSARLLLGFSLPEFELPAWVGDYPIMSYANLAMPLSCCHKESWVLICSPVVPPAAHPAGGRAEGGVCSSGLLLPSCLRVRVWGRDPDSDSYR